jgi:hypothetical protein
MTPNTTTPPPTTVQIVRDGLERIQAVQKRNKVSETDKMNAVRQQMKMGSFHRTADAILASIPQRLVDELSAKQLVLVADALHAALKEEKRAAEALYGVEAIFSYSDECHHCYNHGTIQDHYEDMECPTCNGRGYLHTLYWREPGEDDGDWKTLADGHNLRTVWSEAMAEARKYGWKHILTPDGDRKRVHALRRTA